MSEQEESQYNSPPAPPDADDSKIPKFFGKEEEIECRLCWEIFRKKLCKSCLLKDVFNLLKCFLSSFSLIARKLFESKKVNCILKNLRDSNKTIITSISDGAEEMKRFKLYSTRYNKNKVMKIIR